MDAYCRIWDGMRQDTDVLELIKEAPKEAFDRRRTRHPGFVPEGHLLAAALYYHCPSDAFAQILVRSTGDSILLDALLICVNTRVPKDRVLLILDTVGIASFKKIDRQEWLRLALQTEHRVWFWEETAAGRHLAVEANDMAFLQNTILPNMHRLPKACSDPIRSLLQDHLVGLE